MRRRFPVPVFHGGCAPDLRLTLGRQVDQAPTRVERGLRVGSVRQRTNPPIGPTRLRCLRP
jgi:hypothetical protein